MNLITDIESEVAIAFFANSENQKNSNFSQIKDIIARLNSALKPFDEKSSIQNSGENKKPENFHRIGY